MVYSKIRFFTSWMNSSVESWDTCFFVNYKRGLTLPKTELDSMSKRKLITKFEEELEKCISIFHLPPFSVYHSNNQINDRVEDRVFQPFIFHPYLPSSTCCFKARMLYRPLIINHKLCVS